MEMVVSFCAGAFVVLLVTYFLSLRLERLLISKLYFYKNKIDCMEDMLKKVLEYVAESDMKSRQDWEELRREIETKLRELGDR